MPLLLEELEELLDEELEEFDEDELDELLLEDELLEDEELDCSPVQATRPRASMQANTGFNCIIFLIVIITRHHTIEINR